MSDGFLLDATSYDYEHRKDKDYIKRRMNGEMSEENEEDLTEIQKENVHRNIQEKITRLKMSDEKKERIMNSFENVVVFDYGDLYHLNEEERLRKQKFYGMFRKLSRMRKKHNSLKTYVEAYREVMKCIQAVAEDVQQKNVMSADKFIDKVLKKKITITGVIFPTYTGKNKKRIIWDDVAYLIMNPSLPLDSLDEMLSTDMPEYLENLPFENFFTEEEYQSIVNNTDGDVSTTELTMFDPDTDETHNRNIVLPLGRKRYKKIIKNDPAYLYMVKDIYKQQKKLRDVEDCRYSYDDEDEDRMSIDRDMQYIERKGSKPPKFKGDITNPNDYNRYMLKLEEWNRSHSYITSGSSTVKLEDYEDAKLREVLEQHGYNVKKFYRDYEEEERQKKRRRDQRKKEDELYKKLNKIKRENGEEEYSRDEFSSSSKRKKEKEMKKEKKKAKRLESEANDQLDRVMNDLGMDDLDDLKHRVESFQFTSRGRV